MKNLISKMAIVATGWPQVHVDGLGAVVSMVYHYLSTGATGLLRVKKIKNKDRKKYKNGIRKPMALVATTENP